MKKKIYFLINSLEVGGGERQIVNLCNNFDSRKFDVTILTLKSGVFYSLKSHIQHISLSSIKNNFLMFLMIPYFVIKLRNIFKREKFDNGISTLEIANFVHILSKKNAIIYSVISLDFFRGFFGRIYRFFICWLYPKAGKILSNSIENIYDLSKYLHMSLKYFDVLYNPFDLDNLSSLKSEPIDQGLLKKIQNKKVFITVSRLVWQKRHYRIIDALAVIYQNKDKNFVYFILGDGPEKNKLEKIVKNYGLENNILFLGVQKNVFKYLKIADYFLYASDYEGFPNVFVEALASKLPIITTNFKTGAQEAVLGNYMNKKNNYPCVGPNGVLLDAKLFKKQLFDLYDSLDTIKTEQKGLDSFLVDNVTKKAIQILF